MMFSLAEYLFFLCYEFEGAFVESCRCLPTVEVRYIIIARFYL
jgi:hypothetical protein